MQRPRLRFSPPYPGCTIRPPRRRVDISAAVAAYLARALFPGQIAAETGPGTCGSTAWMTLPQSPPRVSRRLSQLHRDRACRPARPDLLRGPHQCQATWRSGSNAAASSTLRSKQRGSASLHAVSATGPPSILAGHFAADRSSVGAGAVDSHRRLRPDLGCG